MIQTLKDYLSHLPALQNISPELKTLCETFVEEFYEEIKDQIEINGIQNYESQLKKLFESLNGPAKISMLKDKNHRILVIIYMKQLGIEHYKYSYFNKAKLTHKHLERLNKVGPILFSEAVMIASKINIIIKNGSRIYIEDHLYTESQSPVDMKIQQILKLCDDKKRKVNNNLKKLQLILEGDEYVEVIKQLGKMLRDSWKKDKSKLKLMDVVKQPFKKPISSQQQQQQHPNFMDYDSELYSQQTERYEIDKCSFTSSQKRMIQFEKQHAKFEEIENSYSMLDRDEIDFREKSDYFNSLLDSKSI